MICSHLSDEARLRVISAAPPLAPDAQAEALGALRKLFTQFAHEGRCQDFACEADGDGAFLLLAWEGADLSGCSHDKIGKVLAMIEERHHSALLAPPPLVIELDGARHFFTHAQFRQAVAAGTIASSTQAWDTLANSLGAWRSGACRPLPEHWLQPLFARASAAGGAV